MNQNIKSYMLIPLIFICMIPQLEAISVNLQEFKNEPFIFNFIIINKSDSSVRLWKEGSSWGDNLLSFTVKRNGSEMFRLREADRVYTENHPIWMVLIAKSSYFRKVNFQDGSWTITSVRRDITKFTLERSDILEVFYSVPLTIEAQKCGVWTGITSNRIIIQ